MPAAIDAQSTMTISKLSEHIGAEVTGIDLTRPADEATRRRLNRAVVDNIALVIRNQNFTPEQFAAAAAVFGELMEQESIEDRLPGVHFVNTVSSRKKDQQGNIRKVAPGWHTDHTSYLNPPKYTVLYAVELPSKGGGTSVVNMRAGFQSLPDDMKRRIDGMITANVIVSSAIKHTSAERIAMQRQNPVPVMHPLIRTNPDNGTKAIYFSQNRVENIIGMDPEETQTLLDDLLQRTVQQDFVYSHNWQRGDMLLWDNRSSMHKANYDFDPTDPSQNRLLYRVLVKGERPI